MSSPAIPRPSSTVIMVRDADGEPSVYLTRRSHKSHFMADNFVFPGGKVDGVDEDLSFWAECGDLADDALAERLLNTSDGQLTLLPYAVAAIRETWEEAGVLLTACPNGAADALERLHLQRESQKQPVHWLRDFVAANKAALSFSRLWPWAHWIAPKNLAQRFETRFFMTFLPSNQTCRPDPRETPEGRWLTPRAALAANAERRLVLSPPTLVTLHTLLAYETVAALKSALPLTTWGPSLLPKMAFPPIGPMVIQPWDAAYDAPETSLPEGLAGVEILPVGAAFSRLWNDEGTWRPVA